MRATRDEKLGPWSGEQPQERGLTDTNINNHAGFIWSVADLCAVTTSSRTMARSSCRSPSFVGSTAPSSPRRKRLSTPTPRCAARPKTCIRFFRRLLATSSSSTHRSSISRTIGLKQLLRCPTSSFTTPVYRPTSGCHEPQTSPTQRHGGARRRAGVLDEDAQVSRREAQGDQRRPDR